MSQFSWKLRGALGACSVLASSAAAFAISAQPAQAVKRVVSTVPGAHAPILQHVSAIAIDGELGSEGVVVADQWRNQILRIVNGKAEVLAGDGSVCKTPTAPCGDGGDPKKAQLSYPTGIVVVRSGPLRGSVLFVDTGTNRVRRISRDGKEQTISTFAGTGRVSEQAFLDMKAQVTIANKEPGAPELPEETATDHPYLATLADHAGTASNGDGGAADKAILSIPVDIAESRGGRIFVSEQSGAIRQITEDKIISTVGGDGQNEPSTKPQDASSVKLGYARISGTHDGGLLLLEKSGRVLRYRDGKIWILWTPDHSHKVKSMVPPLETLFPNAVEDPTDNTILVVDQRRGWVQRLSAEGEPLEIVAGNGDEGFNAEGVSALNAKLNKPGHMAIHPNGDFFLADSAGIIHSVRKDNSSSDKGKGEEPVPIQVVSDVDPARIGQAASYFDAPAEHSLLLKIPTERLREIAKRLRSADSTTKDAHLWNDMLDTVGGKVAALGQNFLGLRLGLFDDEDESGDEEGVPEPSALEIEKAAVLRRDLTVLKTVAEIFPEPLLRQHFPEKTWDDHKLRLSLEDAVTASDIDLIYIVQEPEAEVVSAPATPSVAEKRELLEVTDESFEGEVLQSDKIVLVDFWATWCKPCKLMTPVLESIASEQGDVKVVKIDVDPNPNVQDTFKVTQLPTFLIFRNGKEVKRIVGKKTKAELEAALQAAAQ